jgi:alkaline phosphatase D
MTHRQVSPATPTDQFVLSASRRHWLGGLAACLGSAALPGCAPALIQHAHSADVPRFGLGVASGGPLPDRLVLWTRLTGPALPEQVEVMWELADDEAFTRIAAQGKEMAETAWAHSVHAEPAGLAPGRWYWYRFTALGQRSAPARTRTAPAPGSSEPLRFAIANCQRWDHGHYAAWRHIVAEQPDLIVFLGDYIYEYGRIEGRVRLHEGGPVRTLDQYRARYAQYKSDPALQAAHAAAPWLITWDDHEVENDYAGLQGLTLQPDFAAQRAAAYRAWWEHMPFPKALRPEDENLRIVGRYDWGDLARFVMADCRQYRSPQACNPPGKGGSRVVRERDCAELRDPARSFLGMEQEAWLARQWSRDRRWNLLAQSTLMARFATPAKREPGAAGSGPGVAPDMVWTDGWEGYPLARQRLLQSVADQQVNGCVVLSGDVHTAYVANLQVDALRSGSPVVATEFCATSITSQGWSQDKLAPLLPLHPHIRYGRGDDHGYMAFEVNATQMSVRARVVDDVLKADSGIHTHASFVVEAGRAGAISH